MGFQPWVWGPWVSIQALHVVQDIENILHFILNSDFKQFKKSEKNII